MITSIYITRELGDVPQLQTFCGEHQLRLTAKSQITFESLDFEIGNPFDVVFFSSPRSVIHFLSSVRIPQNVAIGCVGKGTAEHVRRVGFNPDFVGSTPGEPSKNAKELADWLGNRRILFPVSEISKGSLTEFIPSSQVETVFVYTTKRSPVSIDQHEVYIFSSPSNVDSFLLRNPSPSGIIVAWGKSTERSLREQSIIPSITLLQSEESELNSQLLTLL